jgi:N-methylhydantoinase A
MSLENMMQMIAKFHKEHNRSYGYYNEKMRIQMVNYRICAVGEIEKPNLKKNRSAPHAQTPSQ